MARDAQGERPGHWAPSHCLGCSSQPPRKPPMSVPLSTQARPCDHDGGRYEYDAQDAQVAPEEGGALPTLILTLTLRPNLSLGLSLGLSLTQTLTQTLTPNPNPNPHPHPHPR
eukprot:scaffold28015_cov43-Phaeocystis_antarctica.AAC.1